MDNLILGTAVGYSESVLRRFVGSARRAEFTGKIVLFVDERTVEEQGALHGEYGVELLPCPVAPYHLQSARYRFYERLLLRIQPAVERVLLCDVRDVVFARDIFSAPGIEDHGIHFFLEDKSIGASLYNRAWVEYAFGPKILQRLHALPISCSGTTLGDTDSILKYLQRMNALTELLHSSGREIVCGLDQGIHNFLLYGEEFQSRSRRLWANADGLVFTMGYAQQEPGLTGLPLTAAGTPWRVYHQFDRLNVRELRIFADALDVPVDDVVQQRPPLAEGNTVRLWYSLRDSQGRSIAELPEGRSLVVEISSFTMGNPLTEALSTHAVGDRIALELERAPAKLLPFPARQVLPRRALSRQIVPALGEWITVQNDQGVLCRMKVTDVSENSITVDTSAESAAGPCTLLCKVEARL